MPIRPIDRLLFAQGGRCFFCNGKLSPADASIEHLVAKANGGVNGGDNCVACCRALNSLFGHMSLKEKFRVVLNQHGKFNCPNGGGGTPARSAGSNTPPELQAGVNWCPPRPRDDRLAVVISDLKRRGASRPRTVRTLSSTINALFQKRLTDRDVSELLKKLEAAGVISISDTKVSYRLPRSSD